MHQLHSLHRVLMHVGILHTFALAAIANKGARTPGVDGVTARKARRGLVAFVTTIVTATQTATLMPLARLDIPKADGGARALNLPVLHERAIGREVAWMLNIIFGPSFAPGVVGCRPGFGPLTPHRRRGEAGHPCRKPRGQHWSEAF